MLLQVTRSRSRERLLAMGDLEGVLSSSLGVGAPAPSARTGAPPTGNSSNVGRSGGNGSNGGLGLPSAHPSTGRTGAVNRGGKGGGGRTGRRSVHQPGFLKTVSIIDTLSELAHGPEVRCLAQEPQPRPSRTHSSSRASSSRQAAGATSAGGGGDHGDDTPPRPPGPPVLSADFQQYSEKVYDAVTAPDPDPGLRGRVTGRAPSHPQPRRRTRPQPRGETSLEEGQTTSVGQEARREDDDTGRRPRPDPRGRERGRTPDWIKRIFDIAKKGDLPALVSSVGCASDGGGAVVRLGIGMMKMALVWMLMGCDAML